ncbi:MAG: hypothetical protein JF597_39860 [Streptomyces sp.]|uniref:hypothetical protein n=1 Tax=Streptomyces sp. TaxID=1931 RepID=UPI0025DC9FFF|nr:hypothetical protein [Streptomyces sp.]MBW8799516.1 hypothetical protein [Streptomyces sp.]
MSLGDEPGYPESGHTRTRLPEGDPYGGASRRGGRSSSRSLVTIVGVVVLLIAAIAFANRGGNDAPSNNADTGSTGNGGGQATSPTAASGTKPVETKSDGIPTGYAHSAQGAQSAAANYATALGSDGMFITATRHSIVQTVADPAVMNSMQSGFDADYSADFLKKAGLDADGRAPAGSTFVNRTLPAGTKVTAYSDAKATVAVWCNGLFGMAGEKSTNPVTSNWFTITMKLNWSDGDWKVLESSQTTGPTPVTGDNPVSGTDEISKAVQEFGGFTYAR